jgi:general nucleoside transport system permease protein
VSESVALIADILVRATPLILAGLAVAVAFRAGVLNIGADGQLLAGATVAAMVGVKFGGMLGAGTLPVTLIAGALAGTAWAGIAAVLRTQFQVLEVISTIMLNFVAAYGVSYLVRGPLQEPTHIYPQTATIASGAQLPRLIAGTRLHLGFVLAVGVAVVLWWIFQATAIGFRWRVSGANPFAARSAGLIDVSRVTTMAFLVSGALAGVAGAIEVCGVTFALYEDISPGYGYTAIAVALLAGLHPIGVVATGIAFGALEAGASALQRDANIPATLVSVIEALVILLVIAASQIRGWRQKKGRGQTHVAPARNG